MCQLMTFASGAALQWQPFKERPLALQEYLSTYKKGIEGVTPDDVLAAAKRHLHPFQQTVVMVADAKNVRPQLEASGRAVVPLSLD